MNLSNYSREWSNDTAWRAEHLYITARARRDTPTDLVHATLLRTSPDPVLLLASELAAMDGDNDAESLVCAAIADQLAAGGRNDDAAHAWWQTWEAAAGINPRAQARALGEIAALEFAAGKLRRASELQHRRLDLLRAAAASMDQPVALCDLAEVQHEQGAVATAVTTARIALAAAEDELSLLRAHQTLGNLEHGQGEWRRAEAHFLEALAVARAGHLEREEAALLADFGFNLCAQDKLDEAQECALRVIAATEGAKHLPARGRGYELLGHIAARKGQLEAAINELDCSLHYARKHRRHVAMAALLAEVARLHMLRGEFSRACELASSIPEVQPGTRADLLYVQPLSLRLLVEAAATFEVTDPGQGAWRLDNLRTARQAAAALTLQARESRRRGDSAPSAAARCCNLLVLELEEAIRENRDPRIVGGHLPQEIPVAQREALGRRFDEKRGDSRRFDKLSMLLRGK